jgi:hypothetical protein
MDKRIFNSFIAVHDLDQWHRIVARVTERSRFGLPLELVEQYNDACNGSVADLFRRKKKSACQQADPTGFHALEQAKKVRATLRALLRAGKVSASIDDRIRDLDEHRDLTLPCCEPLAAGEA